MARMWAGHPCSLLLCCFVLGVFDLFTVQGDFLSEYHCPFGGGECRRIKERRDIERRAQLWHKRFLANTASFPDYSNGTRRTPPPFQHYIDFYDLWEPLDLELPHRRLYGDYIARNYRAKRRIKYIPRFKIDPDKAHIIWYFVIEGEQVLDVDDDGLDPNESVTREWDFELDPTAELTSLAEYGFPEPPVFWNPSAQLIANFPKSSPVYLVSHSTDLNYVSPGAETEYYYYPPHGAAPPLNPPLSLFGFHQTEIYVAAFPEPFPFLLNRNYKPARSRMEFLYPYREHIYALVSSCFSKRWEAWNSFSNSTRNPLYTRGLMDDELPVPPRDPETHLRFPFDEHYIELDHFLDYYSKQQRNRRRSPRKRKR